jgi:cell division protein FtsI (penicillin-binding protein 3)
MNYHSRKLLKLHLAPWRMLTIGGLIMAGLTLVATRAFYLQGLHTTYLQDKGNAVASRELVLPAHRGIVSDRNGEPLAISTPVESLWARAAELHPVQTDIDKLAGILELPSATLTQTLKARIKGEFSVQRRLTPDQAAQVAALGMPGLYMQREFRRYYPAGDVAAHVVGFTNVDDRGQEGIERAYQDWLAGKSGERLVLRDRRGNTIRDLQPVRMAQMGGNIALSIDMHIQYLAHRELAAAVEANKARGGGIVVLDAKTGEILALSNLPVFNPNNRKDYNPRLVRNRTVADAYEPGSTMKPFTAAAVIERGLFTPQTIIDVSDGLVVGGKRIRDDHPNHLLTVTQVIQKSSNIGAVKMAMTLTPEQFWDVLHRAGFGEKPGSGFPGETTGHLRPYQGWKPVEQATMAYGHGISVSLLQLARGYMAFANDGVVMPLTLLRRDPTDVVGERLFSPAVAQSVRGMLETVTQDGGTAVRAQVPGYRVAGKTGTAHKVIDGHYSPTRYIASFVGMAPASDPRFIVAVMIDEPMGTSYYGGSVAGPVFAQVMAGALRTFNVSPDAPFEATRLTRSTLPRSTLTRPTLPAQPAAPDTLALPSTPIRTEGPRHGKPA